MRPRAVRTPAPILSYHFTGDRGLNLDEARWAVASRFITLWWVLGDIGSQRPQLGLQSVDSRVMASSKPEGPQTAKVCVTNVAAHTSLELDLDLKSTILDFKKTLQAAFEGSPSPDQQRVGPNHLLDFLWLGLVTFWLNY